MAERSSELTDDTGLDSIARTAGAGSGRFDDGNSTMGASGSAFGEAEDLPAETEQIKAQIEETRSQMGETIDAIQEKLSFANVSEQVSEQVSYAIESAKESIYDATLGRAVFFMKNLGDEISGTRIVKSVQNNPFPVLLIGLGAGLLAYQSFNKTKRPIRGLGRFESEGTGRGSDMSGGRTGNGGSMTGRAYEGVASAADTAYSSVADAAGSAYETVSGTVSSAYSGAGEAANRVYAKAGEFGTKAQENYEYYIEENPLAVGAVAAALGAAVGLAFPSTRYEGQLMGEARQNLLDKAQNVAGEFVDKAKQVAGDAGQVIKDEARALAQ